MVGCPAQVAVSAAVAFPSPAHLEDGMNGFRQSMVFVAVWKFEGKRSYSPLAQAQYYHRVPRITVLLPGRRVLVAPLKSDMRA